jgi:hypothetical protein
MADHHFFLNFTTTSQISLKLLYWVHTAGGSCATNPMEIYKFCQLQEHFEAICNRGNRAYSEVNVKYFNPLTYDSITKIASL